MNNKRGVSIVALVFMIIIMIILASIALTSGLTGYDKAFEAKAKEERRQILNAISSRFGDNQRNKTVYPLVGFEIPEDYYNSDSEDDTKINQITDYLIKVFKSRNRLNADDNALTQEEIKGFVKKNLDCMSYTRIILHDDIIELGIDSISSESIFLINYYSADVVGPIQ
jgi:type II secretory pathway pseudopilin PulG